MLAGAHPRSTFEFPQVDPEPVEGSRALRRSKNAFAEASAISPEPWRRRTHYPRAGPQALLSPLVRLRLPRRKGFSAFSASPRESGSWCRLLDSRKPQASLGDDEVWARFSRACSGYLGERGALLERTVDQCAKLASVAELTALVRAAIGR